MDIIGSLSRAPLAQVFHSKVRWTMTLTSGTEPSAWEGFVRSRKGWLTRGSPSAFTHSHDHCRVSPSFNRWSFLLQPE